MSELADAANAVLDELQGAQVRTEKFLAEYRKNPKGPWENPPVTATLDPLIAMAEILVGLTEEVDKLKEGRS